MSGPEETWEPKGRGDQRRMVSWSGVEGLRGGRASPGYRPVTGIVLTGGEQACVDWLKQAINPWGLDPQHFCVSLAWVLAW